MAATFQLHPHEVWSESVISAGELSGSGDLSHVLPSDVWNDSRFVWGRYSPRGPEDFAVGHIVFRPQDGDPTENFFVSDKVHRARNVEPCNMGEFVFGSPQVDVPRLENALANNSWGRVLYLNDDNEFHDDQTCDPSNWGLFLCANGYGLWKWAEWDGVTWGKASPEGIFRWKAPESTPAQFLATSSSTMLCSYIVSLLADSSSEMAYTRRWLQIPEWDDHTGENSLERLEEMSIWKQGSIYEAQQVLRWLLTKETGTRQQESISAVWRFKPTKRARDNVWTEDDFNYQVISSSYLRKAFALMRSHFQAKLKTDSPYLCTNYWSVTPSLKVIIEQPTAHEQLEARLRLREWCDERGLSFD